jgi:hypothetical protein
MGDYANWSNVMFDAARQLGRAEGFYNGTTKRGDYNTTGRYYRNIIPRASLSYFLHVIHSSYL